MTMTKSFCRYFSLFCAGAALAGTIYTGEAKAAVPKGEPYGMTCQMLRDAAAKTTSLDHCMLRLAFGAVNKDDRVIFTSDNTVAAYDGGSKTFWEGTINKTVITSGRKTSVTIPYYILRDGRNVACFVKNGEEWKEVPFVAAANLLERSYGLQDLFSDNKTAECLNETDKGRSVVFYTNPLPTAELFFTILSAADIFPAPDFSAGFRQKVRPTEIYVRQDYTNGTISNINVDVTWLIRDYLKQYPQALTADEQQAAMRRIMAKGDMNFHISVSDTGKKPEFRDLPADLPASFHIELPKELLSEKQLKEREKAVQSEASSEEPLSPEE